MKRKKQYYVMMTTILFAVSIVFTILVKIIDVQPIGPNQSSVGFASLNQTIFQALGTNTAWYTITNGIGYIAIVIAIGFACLGIFQLITRKSITKVDKNIVVLGILYIIMGITYILFELLIVNYRPILIDGILEASYPSSHSMLVFVIMATAIMQCHIQLKNKRLKTLITSILLILILITSIGRILSGVHWFSDSIGSLLISSSLVSLYYTIVVNFKN